MTKTKIDTPQSKVDEISTDIVKVEKQSKGILIKTQADYEEASNFLSNVIKPRIVKIQNYIKFFTDPYVEQRRVALEKKKEIETMFERTLTPFSVIENNIKSQMSAFLREQEALARKEEARLAKLREKQDEKREAKGLEPIVTPVATVERVETTIKTAEGGKTVAKKSWKFEIEAYSKLPPLVIDEVLTIAMEKGIHDQVIRKLVNSGLRAIAGVRIYEDFDIGVTPQK